jgi:protein-S-isoprenylcysteine O-methyltransferase Ste14
MPRNQFYAHFAGRANVDAANLSCSVMSVAPRLPICVARNKAMTRKTAIFGSLLFFLVVPVTVAGIVPWWISRWRADPPFLGIEPLRLLGAAFALAGSPVLIASFARFAIDGLGTPAPIAPPRRLVVRGFYRYVRNPMYVAILAIVFGQAILLGNRDLLIFGGVFWLACHLFVIFYEEPNLRRRFGDDYEAFRAAVPRWLPRLTPWSPADDDRSDR